MENKTILEQIQRITERLHQLNSVLLQSDEILEIEMDLVRKYVHELDSICQKSTTPSSNKTAPLNFISDDSKNSDHSKLEQEELSPLKPNSIEHLAPATKPEASENKTILEEEKNVFLDDAIKNNSEKNTVISNSIKTHSPQESNHETLLSEPQTKKSLNEKLNTNQAAIIDKIGTLPSDKKIKKLISISDHYLFKNELFGKLQDEYDNALQHIDELQHYEASHQWVMAEYAEKYQWHKKAEAVEHFKILLKKRFSKD